MQSPKTPSKSNFLNKEPSQHSKQFEFSKKKNFFYSSCNLPDSFLPCKETFCVSHVIKSSKKSAESQVFPNLGNDYIKRKIFHFQFYDFSVSSSLHSKVFPNFFHVIFTLKIRIELCTAAKAFDLS